MTKSELIHAALKEWTATVRSSNNEIRAAQQRYISLGPTRGRIRANIAKRRSLSLRHAFSCASEISHMMRRATRRSVKRKDQSGPTGCRCRDVAEASHCTVVDPSCTSSAEDASRVLLGPRQKTERFNDNNNGDDNDDNNNNTGRNNATRLTATLRSRVLIEYVKRLQFRAAESSIRLTGKTRGSSTD